MSEMLPLFKKAHIHSLHIEELLKTGHVEYTYDNNRRNALKQASLLYRIVDGELFRHGTAREYAKYGLRLVVHDDQPEKKLEIIAKCHLDSIGSHLGMNNTIKNVTDTYYWQGISSHVKMYLKQCDLCKTRSRFNAEEWLELERKNIDKKRQNSVFLNEAQREIKKIGRLKKPAPPETFFIVNAERKPDFGVTNQGENMIIDSNNIEYVVETFGQTDGFDDLEEVCHVLNVPDIVQIPERYRSREIEAYLREGTYPDGFTSNQRCGLRGPAAQYQLIDGDLYHEGNKAGSKGMRLVIHDDLPALKVKMIVESHIDEEGSHRGLNKTLNKIGEKYYWVGMSVDVRKFMGHCKICSELGSKRVRYDEKEYEQEAHEVKTRHMKKMNETETSDSSTDLTASAVNYDSSAIQSTEGLEQEGHQVIRLIGPNKEVTEITVAVVNQETVAAEGSEATQMKELENVKGLVTKEMTDAVAQIEAVEAALDIQGLGNNQVEKVAETGQVEKAEPIKDSLVMKSDADDENETDVLLASKSQEIVETKTDQPDGEVVHLDTGNGMVDVVIENDGAEPCDGVLDGVTVVENVDPSGMVVVTSESEQAIEEVARENDRRSEDYTSGLHHVTYYNNVVSVPSVKMSRIIENFFKQNVQPEGFTPNLLIDMSENFEIIDNVLYRRASRYKGRKIVIHDDTPELKYKIISELHLKKNGQHCSELITVQNVAFKYFWEEMKWDVHRYFLACKTCVNENNVERKTNKKVLTVEEHKLFLEKKKRENRLSKHKVMKNRTRAMFDNCMMIGKQDGSQAFEISSVPNKKNIKGNNDSENSDVELHIPDYGNDGNVHFVKVKKQPTSKLYDLVVYLTLEQEQRINDMYSEKHWSYSPISFTKAITEDPEDDDEDYYLLSLKVTEYQEKAINELFQAMGLAVEASVEPRIEDLDSPGLGDKSKKLNTPPVQASTENIIVLNPEPSNSKEGINVKSPPSGTLRETSSQTPLVYKGDNARKEVKREIIEISAKDLQKHIKDTFDVQRSLTRSPIKKQPVSSSPSVVKTTVNVPVVRSMTKDPVIKPMPPLFPSPLATAKRKIDSEPDTPSSESRRSRREIKRPRRFSPDSTPERAVIVKIENVSSEEEITESQKIKEKAKVSVLSKGRIRVNKVMEDIDTPKHHSAREGKGVQMIGGDLEKSKDNLEESGDHEKVDGESNDLDDDELFDGEDDDELEEEDDDDLDDDDDDDDEGEEMETEGMKVPLQMILDDTLEVPEVREVEGDGFVCSLCDAKFRNKAACLTHCQKRQCYKECKQCGKMFQKKNIEKFNEHTELHKSDKKFPCNDCKKVFFSEQHLVIHSRFHKNEHVAKCSQCREEFYTWFQYASHMVHKHSDCNMFTCDVCSAKFANINFMKSEIRFDGNLSYFKCVMCS